MSDAPTLTAALRQCRDALAYALEDEASGVPRASSACRALIRSTLATALPSPAAGGGEAAESLRQFAIEIMEAWPHGDVDGADLQDIAIKHGLLVELIQHEPCHPTQCGCADVVEPADWVRGVDCCVRGPSLAAPPAPQPTAPVQAVPLTEGQLTAAVLADETLRHYFALNGGVGPVSAKGVKVVRAVERAHGITGEQQHGN